MKVTHELEMRCRCPVDGSTDVYTVIIETTALIKVEDILSAIGSFAEPAFQEDLTRKLAAILGCRVTTIGTHSGVKTTCQA